MHMCIIYVKDVYIKDSCIFKLRLASFYSLSMPAEPLTPSDSAKKKPEIQQEVATGDKDSTADHEDCYS